MANNESLFGNFDLFSTPDSDVQKEVDSLYSAPEETKGLALSAGAKQAVTQAARASNDLARQAQAIKQQQNRDAVESAQQAQRSQQQQREQLDRYTRQQEQLEAEQQKIDEANAQARQQALERQIVAEQKAREEAAKAEQARLAELSETIATNPEVVFPSSFNNILNGKDESFNAMGTLEQKYELARQLNDLEAQLAVTLPEDQVSQISRVAKSKAADLLAHNREEADDFFVTDWLRGAQQMVEKRGIVTDSEELSELLTAKRILEGEALVLGAEVDASTDEFARATANNIAIGRTATQLYDGMKDMYGDDSPSQGEIAAALGGDPMRVLKAMSSAEGTVEWEPPPVDVDVVDKIGKYIESRIPEVEGDITEAEGDIARLDSEMSPQTRDEKLNAAYARQRNLARYAGEDIRAEAEGGRSITEKMWSDVSRLGDTAGIAWDNRMSMSVDSAGPMAVAAIAGIVAKRAKLIPGVTVRQSGAIAFASGAVIGGEQFQQEVAMGAREAILNTPLEELEKNRDWQIYVAAAGGDPEVAKRRLAASATTSAYEDNFAIGLAVNMFGLEALTAKVTSRVLAEGTAASARQIVGRSAASLGGTVVGEGVEEGSTRLRTNMVLQEDAYRTNPELYGTEYRAKIFEGVADDAVTGMVLGGVMASAPVAIDSSRQLYANRSSAATQALQANATPEASSGITPGVDPVAPMNDNQEAQYLATSFFRDLPPDQRYIKLRNMYKNRGFVDTQELKQAWHEATQDLTVEQTQALYDAIDTEANLNVMTTPEQKAELASFMSNEIERAYDATNPAAQKKVNTNPFKLAGRTPAQRAFLDNDTSVVTDQLTANAIALRDGNPLPAGQDLELSMAVKDALELTSAGDVDSTGKRSYDWLHVYNNIKRTAPDLTMSQREQLATWAKENLNATAERMSDAELARFQQATAGTNTPVTALPATVNQGPTVSYIPTATTPTGATVTSSVPVATLPTQPTAQPVTGTLTPATNTQTTPYLAALPSGGTNVTSQNQASQQTTGQSTPQTAGTNVPGTTATASIQGTGNYSAPQTTANTVAPVTTTQVSTGVVQNPTVSAITQAGRQIQNDTATLEESSGAPTTTGANAATTEGTGRFGPTNGSAAQADTGTGSVGTETTERNTDGERSTTVTQEGVDSTESLEATIESAIQELPEAEQQVVEEAILLKEEELRTARLQEIGTMYNDARNLREQVLDELEALSAQRSRDTNESARSAKRRNAEYSALKSELDALDNAMTRLEGEIEAIPPARLTALRAPAPVTQAADAADVTSNEDIQMMDRVSSMIQQFEDARTPPTRADATNAVIAETIFGRATARLKSIVRKILNNIGKILSGVAIVSVVVAGSTDAKAQADTQVTVPVTQTIQGVSEATNTVNNYVQQNNDAQGKPYVVADKKAGSLTVFNADGSLRAQAPAIYGRDYSDSAVPGATPAGKFELKYESTDTKGYGGSRQTFLKNKATRGGNPVMEVFSLHRVYTRNESENRQQRLDSQTSTDNRISNGCINVPTEFYNDNFNGDFDGYIYIIPETGRYTGNYFGTDESITEPAGVSRTPVTEPAGVSRTPVTEPAGTSQSPVNRVDQQLNEPVPVPQQEARTESTETATTEIAQTEQNETFAYTKTEAEQEAVRVTNQPTATVAIDSVVTPRPQDGTDSIIAVGTAAVIEGTTPSAQTAIVETIQQDGVGYSMVAVPEGQLTPAEKTIEPVFDTMPTTQLSSMVFGILGALGIGTTVAVRRRRKLTKANAGSTPIFTPITTPPTAPRPLAPSQLPMPSPLLVAPPTPQHQAMLQQQQDKEQTYQAAWFDYMAESGQLEQDIFTEQMLDAANSFIGDVFVDGSNRYAELSGRDVAKKFWRGMFPFGLGEGFTFWGLRFSGGAMPRLDNHLVENGAPRFGIEPDSTIFGTALAGAKTKATQAFEIIQQRYLKPVDDFLMEVSAKSGVPLTEVEEDFGNYATVQHLLNEGYDQHYASMQADIQEVEDKIAAQEAQRAAATPGSQEYKDADRYIDLFGKQKTRLENKLKKTRAMTEGTMPWDGKTRIMGGRTRAESQAIADAVLDKYDAADVTRGDGMIKQAIRDIKNYSVSAGGIDSQAARRYNQSGFSEYVPLYSVPKTEEDLEVDTELESSMWEEMLNQLPENEIRSLGLAYDPSRLRRKGARNPSDNAVNNMRRFAYTQSDLIAQAPVKTAMTQLFELKLQQLTNLTPAEQAEYKELRGRNIEELSDAEQIRIRELEVRAEPTQQQIEDTLADLNSGTGGNSSIPGIERYRKGDPRSDKFKNKKGANIRPITAKGHNAEGIELEYEYYFTDRVLQNEVYNNLPIGSRDENKVVAQIRSATRGASRLMTQLRPIWNLYAYEKEAIERGMNIMFRDLVDVDGNPVSNSATAAIYARKNAEIALKAQEIYRYLVHREIETPMQRSLAKAQASGAIQLYTDVLDKTQSRENRQESWSTEAINWLGEKTESKLRATNTGSKIADGAEVATDLYMKGMVEVPQVIAALSMYQALEEAGVARKEAANRTRDMFDPARGPEWQSNWSAWYPFLRSAMAGNYTTWRSLTQDGWKGWAKFGVSTAAMLGLLFIAGALIGDDDDGVPKLASMSSIRGIPIRAPWLGEDAIYYLPVGFGLPGASLEMAFSTYKGMNGKHTATGMFADTVHAITTNSVPMQTADGSILRDNPLAWVGLSASPELLQPMAEVALNRKSFGGSPVYYGETPRDQRDSEQGSPRTSENAKDAVKFLYNVSGGGVDLRPEEFQHLAENYFGYGPLRALPVAVLRDAEEKTGGLNVTNSEQSGVLGALTSWDIGVDRNALSPIRLVWDMTKRANRLGMKYNVPISDSERASDSKESAMASYRRRLAEADVPIADADFMYNSQEYMKQQKKLQKAYNEAQELYNEARKLGDGAEAEYENMAQKWFALERLAQSYLEENNDYI